MGFQVPRLNHSAKQSLHTFMAEYLSLKEIQKTLTHKSCTMVTAWNNVDTFCWDCIICVKNSVIHQNLIGTFSRFSLHIIHEASTENDNFWSPCHTCMPIPALDCIIGIELEILPMWPVGACSQSCNLSITLMILSANQIAIIVNAAKCRIFTRCRYPTLALNWDDFCKKWLSFLHSLHICLQTTS